LVYHPPRMDELAPDVSVVLPTYNESESLPVVVPSVAQALSAAGLRCEIIVVDDDSPDGTAAVAEGLAGEHPVRVERRTQERGLATAVLRGFALARAPVCVVMDADGSHPVSALPHMVRLIAEDKADIVVGSRNIRGGGSKNWPLFSQLKSRGAAALGFGLTSMTDPTTGFMAVRRSLLHGLTLDPVGWKIVLEIVVKAAPVRVAEVPIVFEDRELGESKQSLRVFLQYALHLLKLYAFRYPSLAELARFCLVGLIGLVVDLGTVSALKESYELDTRLAAVFGFSAAVTSNYVLNRYFTFARGRELPLLWSYLTYVGTNLLGLSVRLVTVHALMVLADLDSGRGYLLSNALGIALATLFNFAGAKYFAFDPERLALGPVAQDDKEPAPEPAHPRTVRYAAVALLALALAYTAADSTVLRVLATDDEGVNVTMARNMVDSFERVLRPSVYPGGRADWLTEDLPALGNTPVFPALLALAGGPLGLPGMGVVPLLALWVIVACSALLPAQHSGRAGLYTALLLSASPGFLALALQLEFEPLLTAFCAAGLYAGVTGTRRRHLGLCFAGGVLLGLGFATKMWLIAPYALAACAFVLAQTTFVRAREDRPLALRRSVVAGLGGFALGASAHLMYVAVRAPEDLPHWVGTVYLGLFSARGVTGGKLSAADDYVAQPLWYYPALLFRDHFHLLPLILFGLPALLRRSRPQAVVVFAIAFGACLGVVLLSVPAVKEPLYVLAVLPPVYMLAGTCLAELEGDAPKYRPANVAGVKAAIFVALLSALAVWITRASDPALVGTRYAALHSAGMAGVALLGSLWIVRRCIAPQLLAGCAIALIGAAWTRQHEPAARADHALAVALAPCLADAPPAYPSFVAPHSKRLMGYLHRAGRDWPDADERPSTLSDASLRAHVLGEAELENPTFASVVAGLEREQREVDVASGASALRLFVRREIRCSAP
jgi:glycosyltransferase involved in cell wall biosynthesis/4-amino-4-deoxy-L-arabinose transferase-like glycosyltransferase